jgi:hypothetical protein
VERDRDILLALDQAVWADAQPVQAGRDAAVVGVEDHGPADLVAQDELLDQELAEQDAGDPADCDPAQVPPGHADQQGQRVGHGDGEQQARGGITDQEQVLHRDAEPAHGGEHAGAQVSRPPGPATPSATSSGSASHHRLRIG